MSTLTATIRIGHAAPLDAGRVIRVLDTGSDWARINIEPIPPHPGRPSKDRVWRAVASAAGVSPDTLRSAARSDSREHIVVRTRHCVCVLLRDLRGMSYPEIAAEVRCGKSHTSIMRACESFRAALKRLSIPHTRLYEAALKQIEQEQTHGDGPPAPHP